MLCSSLFPNGSLSDFKSRYPPSKPSVFSFHLTSLPFPRRCSAKSHSLRRTTYLGCSCSISSSSSSSSSAPEDDSNDELERLLGLLPQRIQRGLSEHEELPQLIEVVMDLGRKPLARFPSGDFILSDSPITHDDIKQATSQVGDFAVDNRAGISRTLHRISAIRNRKDMIIGLTCRVGRAISGSAPLLRDLVQNGASLLLIGPPGVGKTTIIREIARMLANDYHKRVMIVDTSNEIGGDGDIPHAGIGKARRMQVPDSEMQHKVLIEAVENHMPQVIVIDEIGTKLEALAASTIAQRGIQLVATAHGVTLENVIMNPALEMLVGGIESVTLGDEEASRRRVQKTILERKGPSPFNCAVEIVSKTELRVHKSLEATVDSILSGRFPKVEVRRLGSQDYKRTVQMEALAESSFGKDHGFSFDKVQEIDDERARSTEYTSEPLTREKSSADGTTLRLYAYGIAETSIMQGISQLNLDEDAIQLTDNISKADVLIALQSKLKKNPGIQAATRSHDIPIYAIKTVSMTQITKGLAAVMRDLAGSEDSESEDKSNSSEKADAVEEARVAIEQIVIPKGETVELLPRSPYIMSLQVELVEKYQLQHERIGKGPDICLRILPYYIKNDEAKDSSESDQEDNESNELDSSNRNGSVYSVSQLPLLSD